MNYSLECMKYKMKSTVILISKDPLTTLSTLTTKSTLSIPGTAGTSDTFIIKNK
jgi:hypothetical protein